MEDEKEEMSNAVVIVSLGPGDPELITLKGLNLSLIHISEPTRH